jgi:hypothetical protein
VNFFTNEIDAGELAMRTVHRLEHLEEGRTRVVYRTEGRR